MDGWMDPQSINPTSIRSIAPPMTLTMIRAIIAVVIDYHVIEKKWNESRIRMGVMIRQRMNE